MFHKSLVGLMVVSIMLLTSACVPLALPQTIPATPTAEAGEADRGSLDAEAEQVAMTVRQMLMQQVQANFDAIEVVAVEESEWPDGCLGLPATNEACTLALVPGYRVVLAVNGVQYVYRTDATASVIRMAEAPQPQIGDAVITWTQPAEVGVCTTATIGTEGVAFGLCGGPAMQGYLGNPESQHDLMWFMSTYAPFEAETMAGTVVFNGVGSQTATPAEQRMVAEWAQLAHLEAASGRTGASWGLAFAWHREGGIAGFCDDLTVYVTGRVYASSCKGSEPQNLGQARLNAEQLAQLYTWVDTFQGFEVEQSDPAVADAMTVRLVFSGSGEQPASEAEQQAILAFAAELFAELSAGQ